MPITHLQEAVEQSPKASPLIYKLSGENTWFLLTFQLVHCFPRMLRMQFPHLN